jgi:hypothetical protein
MEGGDGIGGGGIGLEGRSRDLFKLGVKWVGRDWILDRFYYLGRPNCGFLFIVFCLFEKFTEVSKIFRAT